MALVIEYNGIKFYQTANGYYLGKVNGTPKWLHRYVWESEIGEIPDGYHIHHIDGDKGHNEVCNLQAIKGVEHLSEHAQNVDKEAIKRNLDNCARPKACKWHKSQAGRKAHKKQYESSNLRKAMREKVALVCQVCGKEYITVKAMLHKSKYCGNNCKATALRRRRKLCQE